MEREIREESDVRFINYVPNITTWIAGTSVVWPGDAQSNRIQEVSERAIMQEILNMMNEKGLTDWEVISYETYYTKETKLNMTSRAGEFWLGLKVFLKRKVSI